MSLKLSKEPLAEEDFDKPESEKATEAARKLTYSENHAGFGLKFLLDCAKTEKDLGISKEFSEELFTAMGNIHYQEQ